MADIEVSRAAADEIPFVYDSWIKSWRTSRWAGCIPNNTFHQATKDAIHQLATRGADIIVARSQGRVLGWICYEVARDGALVVHGLYVKAAYRGFPVADRLLEFPQARRPGFYTYRTDYAEATLRGWTHAPEIARRREAP